MHSHTRTQTHLLAKKRSVWTENNADRFSPSEDGTLCNSFVYPAAAFPSESYVRWLTDRHWSTFIGTGMSCQLVRPQCVPSSLTEVCVRVCVHGENTSGTAAYNSIIGKVGSIFSPGVIINLMCKRTGFCTLWELFIQKLGVLQLVLH